MKFELIWKSYTDKTLNRTTLDKDGWFMLWSGMNYEWIFNMEKCVLDKQETHKRLWKYYG